MHTLWQDLKYGLRMLTKSPGFTAVAILTLALGIGANTAIFSLIDAVILKSLPVKDAQQLVLFKWDTKLPHPSTSQTGADQDLSFSYPAFDELRRGNTTLSSVFAWVPLGFDPQNTTVGINGEPTLANGMMVTGEYFSGLGVEPILGRTINAQDEDTGAPRVAVISYGYWSREFAQDPHVVGINVTLNSIPATIIGVMPPSFYGVDPQAAPDLWVAMWDNPKLRPWGFDPYQSPSVFTARKWIAINIMGRLKPGVKIAQATASLDAVYRRFETEEWTPPKNGDYSHLSLGAASRGLDYLRSSYSNPLYILMGAVGFVLLIACANLATLLLARASARQKEISVRLAIGASRMRLIRQLLTESILMSLAGGALGLLFASWGTHALVTVISGQITLGVSADIGPNWYVLLFAFGAALLTGIIFGLAPAYRATRVELASSMKQSASNVTDFRDKNRLAKSLVTAQVAASLVLLIVAGLFVQTLVNMERRNFGFDQKNLLLFGLDATRDGYTGMRLMDFYNQAMENIRALPGVQSATMLEYKPFGEVSNNTNIEIVGSKQKRDDKTVRFFTVASDFFATMRIPIILGRGIDDTDRVTSQKVAVVNDRFVKEFLKGENPIGQQISGLDDKDQFQIIGVSRDAELTNAHAKPMPKAYLAYAQLPGFLTSMYFAVRTAGTMPGLVPEVRGVIGRMDAQLPLLGIITQSEQTAFQFSQERLFAQLSTFFGLLALLLAMIGLYGTMAYSVTRKTHEIGIRMTLGAKPGDVLRMVVGQGIRLASIGVVIGIVASFGATRLISSMIFGVTATDPVTFAGVVVILILVAVAACYLPARRAAKVDPMVALRYE